MDGFNPRPYARGDEISRETWPVNLVSIHAPMQGATNGGHPRPADPNRFNPRPYARGDPLTRSYDGGQPCFNPRPYARGDALRSKQASD